jgi:hypothetical protein
MGTLLVTSSPFESSVWHVPRPEQHSSLLKIHPATVLSCLFDLHFGLLCSWRRLLGRIQEEEEFDCLRSPTATTATLFFVGKPGFCNRERTCLSPFVTTLFSVSLEWCSSCGFVPWWWNVFLRCASQWADEQRRWNGVVVAACRQRWATLVNIQKWTLRSTW